MPINLLPPEVFNKIAAGEVVERPSSVVKELLENSVDSGATAISVEIWEGGISKITVSDNGRGIEKDDVKLAFMPHATSKIASADDLFDLNTLGFRGEALASIAAVSRVTMTTRTENAGMGQKISIKGGFIEYFEEQGSPKGTYITVENLFFNVPARAKFLKTARSEESEIANITARLILANPGISISLAADGKTVYRSDGRGLRAAVFSVYGMETVQNCLALNYEKDVRISGFVGKPGFFKPNRTYQTLVVNGRYVVNYYISKAVSDVFEGYLMKHQYPFFVIYIDVDKNTVDVNVHPNKTEVRFLNLYNIAGALKKAICAALDSDGGVPEVTRRDADQIANNKRQAANNDQIANYKLQITNEDALSGFFAGGNTDGLRESSEIIKSILRLNTDPDQIGFSAAQGFEEKGAQGNGAPYAPEKNAEASGETAAADGGGLGLSGLGEAKVLGVVFNTYILIEYGGSVYFIDQHAAHERVLYDALNASPKGAMTLSQDMLAPYAFRTNPAETNLLLDNLELIAGIGFWIERFGNDEFRVLSVPAALTDIDIAAFVNTLLEDSAFFKLKNNDILKEKLMRTACRAAVKAGDSLTSGEIDALIKRIVRGDTALRCPHGRPVIIKLEKSEIEKWFKRKL